MSTPDSFAATAAGPAGWYGKLPTLGDFASRRLDAGFIEAWDDWLAQGLADWRAQAPEQWLHDYLAGPSWRFILTPGVIAMAGARTAWAGVLMPSVDRVGRYFPLTLALPLARLPEPGAATEALLRWLRQLDDIAVDALHEDWSIEQLESALEQAGPAPCGGGLDDAGTDASSDLDLQTQPAGHSLWFAIGAQGGQHMQVLDGLPRAHIFQTLLSGSALQPLPLSIDTSESP
ncbi:type VI secretion system-associated protein TagF [Xylophilus rhododendri]|uniref:type VI secretion system-associated protein TagF n=1 Tax=Xylophilus rhododendri TaxID=2697032 RepID=UPI0018A32F13|nr:type VI secretion system-associated protein TagF [Xylophilus rhododendri]